MGTEPMLALGSGPAKASTGASSPVRALKSVVLPLRGSPTMAMRKTLPLRLVSTESAALRVLGGGLVRVFYVPVLAFDNLAVIA